MKLERIWAIPMCCFSVKIAGKIDDLNCVERTFLDTDTAADAQLLRNPCQL